MTEFNVMDYNVTFNYVLFWLIVGLGLLLILYFLPTIVASNRRHPNTTAIFVLNLLAGWSFIGWVGALVWAFTVPGRFAVPVTIRKSEGRCYNDQYCTCGCNG
jgi:hypothetical protein